MLVNRLLEAYEHAGHVTAVDDTFRSLTYKQVTALAGVMRDVIERRTTGDRVGILLPASGAFAATFFGAQWAGRVPIPLNLLLNAEELETIIADAGIESVLTIRHFEKTASEISAKPLFLEDLSLRRRALFKLLGRPAKAPVTQADDVAVILYTSGTTAKPKGVPLTYGNLVSNCVDARQALASALDGENRFLNVLPPFHVFGLTACVLLPVFLKATVYALPRFHAVEVVKTIAAKGVTLMVAIPSMYAAILKLKSVSRETFKTVRIAMSGGEPLPEAVARGFEERFGVKLRQGYGLTETSPVLSVCTLEATKDGTVGRPIPNVEVRIAGSDGAALGAGADGEILVRGPGVMKGYFRNPEETSRVIDGEGWFHTGDMGRLDDDGYLTITGRLKEMLIVSGENVYPREIEAVLEQHPGVLQAAVIGVPDESRGEVPAAFVLCAEGKAPTETELRHFARQSLGGFKVPRQIRISHELPVGPTGKILKRRLRDLL
ncbi:MAG: Long-chain-fatty-acid--CoA ligase [Phycisphaerae bacterium]|nr:Long-chain-fatty-acid--CoA ligase [Phycisphaerae bacterium]